MAVSGARSPLQSPFTTFALVFVAGVAALSWEIVWQLEASLAIGVSALGTAVTLAATTAGMTIGGLAMGRVLDRWRTVRPLRAYALLEAAIGLTGGALLLPGFRLIERIDAVYFARAPGLAPFVQLAGIFALVAPASIALGATVPCFGLIARAQRSSIASLYAVNTAGAAAGVLLVSFVVLPTLGVKVTTIAMACVDLLVAAVAWRAADERAVDVIVADEAPVAAAGATRGALAGVVVIATGFVAFGLEVAWFRALRAALTSTTESFAVVLASILVPLAVGARLANREPARTGFIAAALAGAGALVLAATPLVERIDRAFVHLVLHDFGLLAATWLAGTLLVVGPSMLLLGGCLPRILRAQRDATRWGRLYALNTLGAVAGSLVTAWVLLPHLGFAHTSWLLGGTLVLLGAWIATGRGRVVAVAVGAASFAVAASADEGLGKRRLMLSFDATIARIVSFEETPDSTIAVADDAGHTRMLVIDGFSASDEGPGAHYMTWMGRLPMLLSAHVDRALVICFGTGQTANAVRSERPGALDVVELNPAVLRAGPLFEKNERVLEDPSVHAIVMDGRAWLRRTDRTYDVVTLEPMPPNFAGVNALYSKEFYELVASRLRPGGVVAQWVPFHLLSPHDAQAIAATFHAVLDDSLLWVDPVDFTGILVGRIAGGAEPIGTTWPGLARDGGMVSRDLSPREIFEAVALEGTRLAKYASDGEVVTDDNQLLAYGAKRQRLPYVVPGLAEVNLGVVDRVGRGSRDQSNE
jgi:spermidine synthase